MIRVVMLLGVTVLLAASGVSHRIWRGTWDVSTEPKLFAERLTHVPMEVRDWVGADTPINEEQMANAGAVGYLTRRYIQRGTGAEVSVFIVCGRPGPISVHTPDICYGGMGFKMLNELSRYHIEGDDKMPAFDFTWANFEMPDAVAPPRLRIYWGWKAGPGWKAPKNPRMTFGGEKALYKLYFVYRPLQGASLKEHDPCQDFMKDFLPVLEKTLSPAS